MPGNVSTNNEETLGYRNVVPQKKAKKSMDRMDENDKILERNVNQKKTYTYHQKKHKTLY